ncbi:MAG: hypothetical protein MJE77_28390 [Proteobacteria bacterium]|nr:hypothetical protein [Pseudomonadota bacterium]
MTRTGQSAGLAVLVTVLAWLAGSSCLRYTTTVECDDGLRCPTGSRCAAEQNVCISSTCGNGEIEYSVGEVCDDGNILDLDGCSGDCRVIETCGNGMLDRFERCDPSIESDTKCSDDCISDLACGNGFRDRHEVCDDGNNVSGDGCSAGCDRLELCGDRIRDPGEECTALDGDGDGEVDDSATCDSDCTLPLCGDGHINYNALVVGRGHREQCDDGLLNSDAANAQCRLDCLAQRCGDRIIDSMMGETCDEGDANRDGTPDQTARCDSDCSDAICGDGQLNPAAGEQCDGGDNDGMPGADDTASCDFDCTLVECGDSHVNQAAGESCDEGFRLDTAACDSDCTAVECGDSHTNTVSGEQCDQGTQNSDDADAACRTDCLERRCGDGIIDTDFAEQCDGGGDPDGDGTVDDTVGCDFDCTAVECGDQYVNTTAGERCDQGTDENSDEPNAACRTNCRERRCGDGIRDNLFGEQCDGGDADQDAIADDTDRCDFDCTDIVCGDGHVNPFENPATGDPDDGEQCDAGSANSEQPNATCRTNCLDRRCGDGIVDSAFGEVCDGQTGCSGQDLCNDHCTACT